MQSRSIRERSRVRTRRLASRCLLCIVPLLAFSGPFWLFLILRLPTEDAGHTVPLRITAAPLAIATGLDLQGERFVERLVRLGYQRVGRPVEAPGEFAEWQGAIDLYLRDFAYPRGYVQALPIRILVEGGRIQRVVRLPEGAETYHLQLEPEPIGGLLGEARGIRNWVPLAEIPPSLVAAVLLVEDRRFYEHWGVDFKALARAAIINVRRGEIIQGGSTVTQQLAKNLYLTPARTWWRKGKELIAALVLELKYSKEAILESYLNSIYLGQFRSLEIRGIGEAARIYFGKGAHDLDLPEVALLAGMIRAPNVYSPLRHRESARRRRDQILAELYAEGKVSREDYRRAAGEPVRINSAALTPGDAPYFTDFVVGRLEARGRGLLTATGGTIFTTLNPVWQRAAEEALFAGLRAIEGRHPRLRAQGSAALQGALVALDPRSGAIRAMVGGRGYGASQFNRAVQARRQPGSLFKVLVYLAALEGVGRKTFTPATIIEDRPVTFPAADGWWAPQNFDGRFRGRVSLRTALEESLNVPAVLIAREVGTEQIVSLARRLGFAGPFRSDLSLALGTSEVSLLEIVGAFGALASGGVFHPPQAIEEIMGVKGGDAAWLVPPPVRVVDEATAYVMTSLLAGVIDRGTAARARTLGLTGTAAGKTGTTDGFRDAWFVGYTPDLVAGVWVGFDDGRSLGKGGAAFALPIWVDFVSRVGSNPRLDFPIPPGTRFREIDPETGLLPTPLCPQRVIEVFVEGGAPTASCPLHRAEPWSEP